MAKIIEISLCMGSSCFARGNNRLLEALEEAVEKNAWRERISIAGARCANLCGDGPNVTVDGTLYQGLDEGAFMDILEKKMTALI